MASATATPPPRILLVGQPNCGKSTIFNQVAGYQSISTNYSGATVSCTTTQITVAGQLFELADLPGIYSFVGWDAASVESKRFIQDRNYSLIINVIDASLLSRSLELTLQLFELGVPMIVCLNMMDDAERKGCIIDAARLAELLGVPVIPTIAVQGSGIDDLFIRAAKMIEKPLYPTIFPMSRHVEEAVQAVHDQLKAQSPVPLENVRLCAIRLLEGEPDAVSCGNICSPEISAAVSRWQEKLEQDHGQPSDSVIAAERHALSMQLSEQVTVLRQAKQSFRTRIDQYVMHPFWGYVILAAVLYSFFIVIFRFGALLEQPVLHWFELGTLWITQLLGSTSVAAHVVTGILQGLAGGTAIVLPYLFPFLMGMAVLEDVGYLPRIAFLMDNFMHRIGLHGTAVIPGILGYGCSVPAIMATRILPSSRDRFIAAVAALLIPCSARMTIILGLVGFYLGGTAAFLIYLFNLIVITLIGTVLARLMPADSPGMILVIPPYQRPQIRTLLAKTWLRSKDFVIFAWPILIIGSLMLSLAEAYQYDHLINSLLSPLTRLLDLPLATGTTLIFGILRKELSMVMLMQALGTTDVGSVMSSVQLVVFTLFIVFYFPCLATFGILGREIGWRRAIAASLLTLALAIIIGVAARWLLPLFLS